MNRLAWETLVKLEPHLQELRDRAKRLKPEPDADYFCANEAWLRGGLKDELCALVGWDRISGDPILRTEEAYDVAYDAVYKELPDCFNCVCM